MDLMYCMISRWKGENVSTTEISNMLTDLDFIHDANVYGVAVPGNKSHNTTSDRSICRVNVLLYNLTLYKENYRAFLKKFSYFKCHCHSVFYV